MSINKTIIDQANDPLPLSNSEYTVYSHTPTTLTLHSGSGFPADTLHIHQPGGHLHITTHRLVFVAPCVDGNTCTDRMGFKTFSAHLDDVKIKVDGRKLKIDTVLVEANKNAEVSIEFPSDYDAQAAYSAIDGNADGKVCKK